MYAVLVAVVLKHHTQSAYCAVHSQINEDLHLQKGVIEKVLENTITGEISAVLMFLSLNL